MCDCIEKINAELAASEFPNTMVEYPLFGPRLTFVVTCKRDDKIRQKPKRVFANYCPFCGEKYEHLKAARTPVSEAADMVVIGSLRGVTR